MMHDSDLITPKVLTSKFLSPLLQAEGLKVSNLGDNDLYIDSPIGFPDCGIKIERSGEFVTLNVIESFKPSVPQIQRLACVNNINTDYEIIHASTYKDTDILFTYVIRVGEFSTKENVAAVINRFVSICAKAIKDNVKSLKSTNEDAPKESTETKEDAKKRSGLRFQSMGGFGTVTCADCNYAEGITSFTHGIRNSRTGYQCQSCGKFAAIDETYPFPDYNVFEYPDTLKDVPHEFRPDVIANIQSRIRSIENQMLKTPKDKWSSSWLKDIARYQNGLSDVPAEELTQIESTLNSVRASFEASLVCECGGVRSREQILFCPVCKSKAVTYHCTAIT